MTVLNPGPEPKYVTIALTEEQCILLQTLSKVDMAYCLNKVLNVPQAKADDQFTVIWNLFSNYEQFMKVVEWRHDDNVRAYRNVNTITVFLIQTLIENFPHLPEKQLMPQVAERVEKLGASILEAANKALDNTTVDQPFYQNETKARA